MARAADKGLVYTVDPAAMDPRLYRPRYDLIISMYYQAMVQDAIHQIFMSDLIGYDLIANKPTVRVSNRLRV